MKKLAYIILFLSLLLFFSLPSKAQAQRCWISSISHVNFGNISVSSLLTDPQDTVGSITVHCHPAEDVTITLSPGQSGNCNQRYMLSGGNNLFYNLYTNSARTIIWGDGICGSTVSLKANPPGDTVYIYARVPQGQDPAVGSYSDNITITIRWAGGSTTAALNVSAAVLPECRFRTPKETTINVTLDPSLSGNVTGTSSLSFWCARGTSYSVTDDDGLYESGINQNRVKHSTLSEYIPYTFSYNPSSGTGNGAQNPITLNFSATFIYNDFANASAGDYRDTVTITVNP